MASGISKNIMAFYLRKYQTCCAGAMSSSILMNGGKRQHWKSFMTTKHWNRKTKGVFKVWKLFPKSLIQCFVLHLSLFFGLLVCINLSKQFNLCCNTNLPWTVWALNTNIIPRFWSLAWWRETKVCETGITFWYNDKINTKHQHVLDKKYQQRWR